MRTRSSKNATKKSPSHKKRSVKSSSITVDTFDSSFITEINEKEDDPEEILLSAGSSQVQQQPTPQEIYDPYTLFSEVYETPSDYERFKKNSVQMDKNELGSVMLSRNAESLSTEPNIESVPDSPEKSFHDESTPAHSDFEDNARQLEKLRNRIQDLEKKRKLCITHIQMLREDSFNKTCKLLKTETKLACKAASIVNLRLENFNIKKSMEKISEEKMDLQMQIDAKEAQLQQYEYLVESYKTKEAQNEIKLKNLAILQQKNKRAERKISKLKVKNMQLHRRIVLCRRINKQSLNMLEGIKETTERILPAKEKRKIDALMSEISKSLNIDINE